MKKIPKTPFKALCIKEFNIKRNHDVKMHAWGCLELFRIYKFTGNNPNRLYTTARVVEGAILLRPGKYEGGFNIARKEEEASESVPYFWDHFMPI